MGREIWAAEGWLAGEGAGVGFCVRDEEIEGKLRWYEAERYEVVRCWIEFRDEDRIGVESRGRGFGDVCLGILGENRSFWSGR